MLQRCFRDFKSESHAANVVCASERFQNYFSDAWKTCLFNTFTNIQILTINEELRHSPLGSNSKWNRVQRRNFPSFFFFSFSPLPIFSSALSGPSRTGPILRVPRCCQWGNQWGKEKKTWDEKNKARHCTAQSMRLHKTQDLDVDGR